MKEGGIVVINFGSQYVQLIARRVRELNVYSEILPWDTPLEEIIKRKPKGIIFSGGPASVYSKDAPLPPEGIYDLGIPILGICYGLQVLAHQLGGKVAPADKHEYGRATLTVLKENKLFKGLPKEFQVWMSHADKVTELPQGFEVLAVSDNAPFAVIANPEREFYGVQFHPEVTHTQYGRQIIANFVFEIAKANRNWFMENFVEEQIKKIREQVGDKKVIAAISGGVDSTVSAVLTYKAIGDNLIPIFIDHGLLREGERREVERNLKSLGLPLRVVDAGEIFLSRLEGVEDPEEKRKIIGHTFIEVFEREAKKYEGVKFLLQGTLYPDVIESAGVKGAAKIKSHHNVGGLPEMMNLKLLEPLRELFKDEVRKLGKILGIPEEVLGRHPFPGPGLAIRILGPLTREDLNLLRKADKIFIEELKKWGLYDKVWQAFAVLLPVKTVGVMGDVRTYERVVALRAVDSSDGMTADWSKLPYQFLDHVMRRIINEVRGINRVVYDITSKPPGTIEWE
ncbi:MAG TPA: glutamine-hydrolyzing GMP synthase [Aquifex aeolicus]|uniref:GMP synthase [glutamine-hydrolyzing] n=1 Tax=Aquifex aeolicus TaxID=63363 RepID=A0A9D0YNS0_AQUAO|nr:glutamine-hydrolyzing GMP synthase [Aquificales bacterium]HIP97906.1 glutamine-hydrolyzing GMP synthase [Aquifex aeolicus]HIQ25990.1 glutamine-hydrolyzing GMP synthase [Aquifex aeolicus]